MRSSLMKKGKERTFFRSLFSIEKFPLEKLCLFRKDSKGGRWRKELEEEEDCGEKRVVIHFVVNILIGFERSWTNS